MQDIHNDGAREKHEQSFDKINSKYYYGVICNKPIPKITKNFRPAS